VVVLRVEAEAFHFGERLIVLTHGGVGVALVEGLGVAEHQFLEKTFGVDLAVVIQLGLLFREADVEQMLFEVAHELQVELTLIAVEVEEDNLGAVV